MDTEKPFNLITFTDTTKHVCTCSAISIFLIILFIISPLGSLFAFSKWIKWIILCILFYTAFLNIKQTDYLRKANQYSLSPEVSSQLTINTLCSYVFTIFIGLLIIFVIKSFF